MLISLMVFIVNGMDTDHRQPGPKRQKTYDQSYPTLWRLAHDEPLIELDKLTIEQLAEEDYLIKQILDARCTSTDLQAQLNVPSKVRKFTNAGFRTCNELELTENTERLGELEERLKRIQAKLYPACQQCQKSESSNKDSQIEALMKEVEDRKNQFKELLQAYQKRIESESKRIEDLDAATNTIAQHVVEKNDMQQELQTLQTIVNGCGKASEQAKTPSASDSTRIRRKSNGEKLWGKVEQTVHGDLDCFGQIAKLQANVTKLEGQLSERDKSLETCKTTLNDQVSEGNRSREEVKSLNEQIRAAKDANDQLSEKQAALELDFTEASQRAEDLTTCRQQLASCRRASSAKKTDNHDTDKRRV